MFARFDVFQVDSDEHLRWLGAFENLEKAHARVAQATRENPKAEHVVKDGETLRRQTFAPGQAPPKTGEVLRSI